MFRCEPLLRFRPLLAASLVVLALWAAPEPSFAQAPRNFPAHALRGELVVTQAPEVLLNNQAARLAPGARIRGTNNLLVMSGQLTGHRIPVHYTLDGSGLLLDIWLLTPAELARRPWPTSAQQAAQWTFNPDAQTWSPR